MIEVAMTYLSVWQYLLLEWKSKHDMKKET